MIYYKSVDNEVIVGISTVNTDGNGNISEEEYEFLKTMITEKPEGKQIRDNGDGTYSYIDMPPMPELEDSEALSILLGGEGS